MEVRIVRHCHASIMVPLLALLLMGCHREVVHAPAAIVDRIELRTPLPEALLSSPLTVEGKARGPWFFEASFPVYLLDAKGDTIAATPAHAIGEWMTTEFVPFKATLSFSLPASKTGTLILSKDNPSGLPEHAAELRVPVRFQ
ncbi:MAG: Gmad2 immunoglobulin-like domain-containing protein [Gemmatimonadota bacterium]